MISYKKKLDRNIYFANVWIVCITPIERLNSAITVASISILCVPIVTLLGSLDDSIATDRSMKDLDETQEKYNQIQSSWGWKLHVFLTFPLLIY
jgi:hypothetical protein